MEREQVDTLVQMVELTDDFVAHMIESCGSDSLVATSIILSRLVKINDEAGTGHIFRQLLQEVHNIPPATAPNVH